MFKSLQSKDFILQLINDDNKEEIYALLQDFPDAKELTEEIEENYLPDYSKGKRITFGFCAFRNEQPDRPAGLSLLGISDWNELKGFTGADTPAILRGQGIAPGCKPHLFYLAFEILGLHRVESGCRVSNVSSKRSIEKTPGFQLEGIMRESGKNDQGVFEDEYLYAILRKDWVRLYDLREIRISA